MFTLPIDFTDRLRKLYSSRYDKVIESFFLDKPVTVRINPLRVSVFQCINTLEQRKIEFKKVGWYDNALIISCDKRSLTALEEYKKGWFYIQSLSSMIPALVLDPKPGENILDMAAAPGSKTTQIAAMIQNNGEIVANDISGERIFKLKSNCKRQGATNIIEIRFPGQILWQKYPNYFDRVLVDVPCSMEGLFDVNVPKTIEHWSPKKVKNLAKLQRLMLRSAIGCVKPGGTIVYSTCTLSPEENEEVVDWVLRRESGNIALREIAVPGLDMVDGLTGWGNKRYNNDLAKTKRIVPDGTMEGFFIAKIKKLDLSADPQ